jgi:putative acetyltransferase
MFCMGETNQVKHDGRNVAGRCSQVTTDTVVPDNGAMRIRAERHEDIPHIRAVNLAAFDTDLEANLVDALRAQASPFVSLVAEDKDKDKDKDKDEDEDERAIVAHVLFTPVTLDGADELRLMGLAPMAVVPAKQRQGVGTALVREGLERCRRIDAHAIVVLGHAEYYPRFGFVPASQFGLRSEYDVPDELFMVVELEKGVLNGKSGIVRYHPAFREA